MPLLYAALVRGAARRAGRCRDGGGSAKAGGLGRRACYPHPDAALPGGWHPSILAARSRLHRTPVKKTVTGERYAYGHRVWTAAHQELTRSGVWGSLGRFAVGSNKLLNSELKRSANGSPLLWRLGLCLKLSVADLMVSADNSCGGACAPCRLRARDLLVR